MHKKYRWGINNTQKPRPYADFTQYTESTGGVCQTSHNAQKVQVGFVRHHTTHRKYRWVCQTSHNTEKVQVGFVRHHTTHRKYRWDLSDFTKHTEGICGVWTTHRKYKLGLSDFVRCTESTGRGMKNTQKPRPYTEVVGSNLISGSGSPPTPPTHLKQVASVSSPMDKTQTKKGSHQLQTYVHHTNSSKNKMK